MKKTLSFLLAAIVCFAMQSCEKLTEVLSFGSDITVNVNIDATALNVSTVKVQTLVESVDCSLDTAHCAVRVFSNGKPQIIAVTDANDNLLMMYRGPVTDGGTITINANTTALGLVTFNPLYGPIPAADYNALTSVLQGANQWSAYSEAVNTAIANGVDLTSTQNTELLAMLHNLLRELSEQAFAGQENLEAAAVNASSFLNCYPLIATAYQNTLTLRTTGNCPSYYGGLFDSEGNKIKDVAVTASSRYAFMDNLNASVNNNSYGSPTDISFEEGGSYTINLSCTAESAILDFYIRLVNNILGTIGADIDPMMVSAVTPLLRNKVNELGIDLANIQPDEVMDLICDGYDVVLEYLRNEGEILSGGDANWDLGSVLLKRLNNVYKEVHTTTDVLLYTSYNFSGSEEGEGTGNNNITVRVSYVPGTDGIPGVLIPQQGIDISIVSGNNQVGKTFHTLDNPLTVKVRTFDGEGNTSDAANYSVRFAVVSGEGQLSQTNVTTNNQGLASTNWTLGSGESGNSQTVYAVVVDGQGNEISARVYFNALIANDRYLVSLCCTWADPSNYASRFVMDFAPISNASGVVDLYPAVGQAWGEQSDYDNTAESIEMAGTYNTSTREVHLVISMYITDTRIIGNGPRIKFRVDQYDFTLPTTENSSFGVDGNKIWDGITDGGGEWGGGCATYTYFQHFNDNNPDVAAPQPTAVPAGQEGFLMHK
jgi:hypothetical protein